MGRYTEHARRVAEEFGPGHHGVDALTAAIEKVIKTFVEHDLEWAALSAEDHAKRLRERGRED